jgi:hypothetical protein
MSEAPWSSSNRKPALYRVVRAVTIIAVLGGVVVGLHRNDLLREGAKRVGRETQYLELERRLIGVPGYGTPRSVESNLSAPVNAAAAASPPAAAPVALLEKPAEPSAPPADAPAASPPTPSVPEVVAAVAVAPAPPPPAEPAAAAAPVVTPPAPAPAAAPVDPMKPISLDDLPVLRTGQATAKAALVAEAPAPSSAPKSAARKVQVFDLDANSPKPKSKPKAEKAEKTAQAPKPAPAPKPAKKEKEPDQTAPRAGDNPLKAAIRDAMRKGK